MIEKEPDLSGFFCFRCGEVILAVLLQKKGQQYRQNQLTIYSVYRGLTPP